jgi:hypothetical protein
LLAYVSFVTHNKLPDHAIFYLFQPLLGFDFVNIIFASRGSHNSNNPLMHHENSLVDIYVWELYA